jgi:hypothetical protein
MKKIFCYIGLLLSVAGCKKFDNSNPNVPTVVNPGVVLPQVFFNVSNTLVNNAFELNNELIQYTCMNNTFTEVQRFKLQPSNSNGIWGMYNRLRDLDDIIRMSEAGTDLQNYKAIAMITRVYILSVITDTYGDVPYSEAGKAAGDKIYGPKYDNQKDIYTDMLARLKEGADLIDVAKGLSLGGDAIFGGSMLKWKKFANSLRLRLLMRVSAKTEMDAVTKIREILSNPTTYPLMEANADNFIYKYSGSLPDASPISLAILRDFDFKYKVVSAFIVDSMKKFSDTRLFQYARPTSASASTSSPQYVGLPNSLPVTESANYNGGYNFQSYLGTRFQNNTEPAIWMTYAEVLFLKAEAAAKGYYTADAKDLYEKGIQASFQYWGASFDAAYLQQPGVVYDGSLARIYLQKFFALFFTGMEAWFEYRRTGYPNLVPGPTNVNGGKIPVRIPYPLEEQSLNTDHYNEAIGRMGGDNMNAKVWWQQ